MPILAQNKTAPLEKTRTAVYQKATGPDSGSISPWIAANAGFLLALSVFVVLYKSTLISLVHTWARSGTFQHAFLIVPIAIYLIWLKRSAMARLEPYPNAYGLLLLIVLSSVWLLGYMINAQILLHFSFIAVIPALVLAFYGNGIAKVLLFPLAYLFFAVPAGESLIAPLQDFTAHFTVKALQLVTIPVYTEGIYISIPNGEFEVAEACSGIRFFIASAALGSLYAYLTFRSYRRRVLFVLITMAVSIIANGLRAFGIVAIGYMTDMRHATGADHLIYGWQFFGLVMLLLFWGGWRWREAGEGEASIAVHRGECRGTVHYVLWMLIVLAILSLGPMMVENMSQNTGGSGTKVVLEAPPGGDGWKETSTTASRWSPLFIGADAYLSRDYSYGSRHVSLYMAYYAHRPKSSGGELINYANRVYDPGAWRQIAYTEQIARLGGNEEMPVNELHLRSGQSDRMVWYWYSIGHHHTPNQSSAMIYQIWGQLMGIPSRSAVTAISITFAPGGERDARRLLSSFLMDMGDLLKKNMLQARVR